MYTKKVEESSGADDELEEHFNLNIVPLAVKNYQKSTLWFCFIISLLAMRGASSFSVVLAYFTVIARIAQLISITIVQSEKAAQICYGLATLFIILMWFHEFATENADIIHEAHPTP